MKKMSLLFAIMFAFMSCNCQKKTIKQTSLSSNEKSMNKEAELPRLEYEANTRGFYLKLIVENQSINVSTDRNGEDKGTSIALSDKDLSEMITAYKEVNLEDLAAYKDPTQKRFYDGAAIAHLKITTGGKDYQTTDFDHGIPPVEIEKLVNKIVSLAKKE